MSDTDTVAVHWQVGGNIPGYLPDAEVVCCGASVLAALEYMRTELERMEDYLYDSCPTLDDMGRCCCEWEFLSDSLCPYPRGHRLCLCPAPGTMVPCGSGWGDPYPSLCEHCQDAEDLHVVRTRNWPPSARVEGIPGHRDPILRMESYLVTVPRGRIFWARPSSAADCCEHGPCAEDPIDE